MKAKNFTFYGFWKCTLVGLMILIGGKISGQTWLELYEPRIGFDIVEADNGDLLIVGESAYSTDLDVTTFIKRVDSDGNEIWTTPLLSPTKLSTSHHLIKKSNNNFVVASIDLEFLNGQDTVKAIRLLEINNAGEILWENNHLFDNNGYNIDGFIEANDGGFLILIRSIYKDFVIKMDAVGIAEWENLFFNISYSSVLQLANGNFLFAGRTYNVNNYDVALMTVSSEGDSLDFKSFHLTDESDSSIGITETGDNNLLILTGNHLLKTTFQGDSIWSKPIPAINHTPALPYAKNIFLRADGGFDILVWELWPSTNTYNTQIIQLDSIGERINEDNFLQNTVGLSMIPCNSGGYAVTGLSYFSEPSSFIAKADSLGQFTHKFIQGNIFKDDNFSCDYDSLEIGLNNWTVSVEDLDNSITTYATTDSLGNYSINVNEGTYEVTAQIPSVVWQSCLGFNPQTVTLDTLSGDTIIVDFPIQPIFDCPIMTVDISASLLRRCFDNTYYVEYCNEGTQPALNAFVEVKLDEYMDILSASLPYFNQGDSLLIFTVGDIEIGECGQFSIEVYLDCNSTVLGQTHCSEAHIFPDTLCFPLDPNWDMSSISVEGECTADSVRFFIKNEGTGNMAAPLPYEIVIDEIIMMQGQFELNSGEVMEVAVEAQSETYRMEAEQSPGHPGNSMPSATVEGCPNFGSLGFWWWFSQNDEDKFIDIDCQENIASFDPNDKQAFPRGYGDEHFIEPETEIEYKIRFQNTGTDTAFRVVVRDTLSEFLDINTFRMDVTSHIYDWEILGQRVLKVTFKDIMLPDSNINEPASHGFFKYSIRVKEDVPLGTVVENRAGIYFDFNEPVMTNMVFHTIDTCFVEGDCIVGADDFEKALNQLTVFPNPFTESATFQIKGRQFQELTLDVFDVAGRTIRQVTGNGNSIDFEANEIAGGIYFFTLRGDGRLLGSGKLVLTN